MTNMPQPPNYGGGSVPQNQSYNASFAPQPVAKKPEPPIDQPWYEADFVGAFLRFWKKYAVFSGRASRAEYWWAFLVVGGVSLVFGLLGLIPTAGIVFLIILSLFGLAVIVPTIAVTVRRLHDTNMPGWWAAVIWGASALGSLLIGIGTTMTDPCAGYEGWEKQACELADEYGLTEYIPENGASLSGGGIALIVIGVIIALAALGLMVYLLIRPADPAGAQYDVPTGAQGYGFGFQSTPVAAPAAAAPAAAPEASTAPAAPAAPATPAAPAAPAAPEAPAEPEADEA